VGSILQETGPVFVSIKIFPEVENLPIGLRRRPVTRSRAETIKTLQQTLGIALP
jgi:hypothetical protein